VGCWHPINASNTYYLENNLGWSGVGIDALQEMAPRWKRLRPHSRFLNYIVTDKAGALEPFYRVDLTDISSTEKPEAGPAGNPIASKSVMVPTITLTRALEENGLTRIDFMSIDIEGAELRALAGFDIERFRPLLVCVESKVKNREQLMAYFKQHRYHRIDKYLKYDQTNWYFTPDATD
jgi:FkbM family methyltransferase